VGNSVKKDAKEKTPVLVISRNRMKEPLAILKFEDLLKFMVNSREGKDE